MLYSVNLKKTYFSFRLKRDEKPCSLKVVPIFFLVDVIRHYVVNVMARYYCLYGSFVESTRTEIPSKQLTTVLEDPQELFSRVI